MKKDDICDVVYALAQTSATLCGLTIYDVEYVREGPNNYLRVFIDKEDGVTIDDCENFTRAMDPILDEADPIDEQYYFEVSSVGIDRQLKKEKDFNRFMGSKIVIGLFAPLDGRKEITGELTAYKDGIITVLVNGETVLIDLKNTTVVKPLIEF